MIPLGILASARVASGAWTPASLGTLAAWFDASDAATITSSAGLVSQWSDKSGLARHVTQATDIRKPKTGTRTVNGLNVLDFLHDGTNGCFLSRALTFAQPSTFAVVSVHDVSTGTRAVVSAGATPQYAGFDAGLARFVVSAGTMLSSGVSYTSSQAQITAIFNGASSAVRVDGTGATGSAGTNGMTTFYIGGRRPDVNVDYLDGAVAEVVACSSALSGTDLTNLENYLKTKWGTP